MTTLHPLPVAPRGMARSRDSDAHVGRQVHGALRERRTARYRGVRRRRWRKVSEAYDVIHIGIRFQREHIACALLAPGVSPESSLPPVVVAPIAWTHTHTNTVAHNKRQTTNDKRQTPPVPALPLVPAEPVVRSIGLIWFGFRFRGEYRRGTRHGPGFMESPNGAQFEGWFRDGVAHGDGILTWPDGGKFIGKYVHGKVQYGIYIS